METQQAGDDVKAGADRGTAVAEATADKVSPEGSRLRWPRGPFREPGNHNESQVFRYVPISHDARYFFCSAVNVSIATPMPVSLSRAISLSMSAGTGYTFFSKRL